MSDEAETVGNLALMKLCIWNVLADCFFIAVVAFILKGYCGWVSG